MLLVQLKNKNIFLVFKEFIVPNGLVVVVVLLPKILDVVEAVGAAENVANRKIYIKNLF